MTTLIKGNVKFIILSLFFLIISLTVLIMAFSVGYQTQKIVSELNQRADYLTARIDLNGSDYAKLDSYENVNGKMKAIINEIGETEIFDFYEVFFHPIYIVDYTGSEIFMYGYDFGDTRNISITGPSGEIVEAANIKSTQLSMNCFSTFGIEISGGRGFNESEYVYDGDASIPVLLGSEFSGQYSLGDIFEAEYLFGFFEFEIVGFLDSETYIPIGSSLTYLDRQMVIPMFNIDEQSNFSSSDFEFIYLSNKITGYINLNAGYELSDAQNFLNSVTDRNEFPRYKIMNTPNIVSISGLPLDASFASSIVNLAYLLSGVFLLINTLFSYKILKSRRNRIAAMLISGEKASSILFRWIIEFLIQVLAASGASLAISYWVLGSVLVDYRYGIVVALIVLAQIFLEKILYSRNNLSKALVEEAKNVD